MKNVTYRLNFWAKYAWVDSAVLQTGLGLSLFDHLPREGEIGLAPATLAECLVSSLRGIQVITEPLVATHLLNADQNDRLTVPRTIAEALQSDSFNSSLRSAQAWWGPSRQLVPAVRQGEPVEDGDRAWDLLDRYEDFFLRPPPLGSSVSDSLFDRTARHFLRTRALMAANELGLLDCLQSGSQSLDHLGEACQADTRGLQVLLDTLVQMHLLTRERTSYAYHPAVQDAWGHRQWKAYAQGLQITELLWDALGQLPLYVIDRSRDTVIGSDLPDAEFYTALARFNTLVFPEYLRLARAVLAGLAQTRSLVHTQVLDVGTGSGVWGIALAQTEPTALVTLLDQAPVLAQAERNLERFQLRDQIRLWEADLREVDYGEAAFDVIVLGQICHIQPPHTLPGLFARLARALRPDGRLVIADFVLNDQRDAPLNYLYFAVKEFVTTSGSLMSLPEFTDFLTTVGLTVRGFSRFSGIDIIFAGHGHSRR